ncbi:MAG: EFR1 family ferrodoxin [Clostridiales bacterium]|nr:EFR1 family ferrodoxin [Clostridiales bacterium]
MIFYFSATGNSQSVAEQIASALDSRIISIGLAMRDGHFEFDVSGDEYVGFVVPTFAYTLPGVVAMFLDKLELKGYDAQYTFGVFTCGEGTGDEGSALGLALKNKGLGYNGSFDVVMPDNFILWSNIPSDDVLASKLSSARKTVDGIIEKLKAKENGKLTGKAPRMPFMPTERISTSAGTSKLHVTEKCMGCGKCANVCPMSCIRIEHTHASPVWEGDCTMCLACLHHCPNAAIEYEDQTLRKKRYLNPDCKLQLKNKY